MKVLWPVILRFIRAGIATLIPILIQMLQDSSDPTWMAIAPVLMMIGKYLRNKFGWTWLPV